MGSNAVSKICSQCHSPIENDSKFCTKCGKKIEESAGLSADKGDADRSAFSVASFHVLLLLILITFMSWHVVFESAGVAIYLAENSYRMRNFQDFAGCMPGY